MTPEELIALYKDCINTHKELAATSSNHVLVSTSLNTIKALQSTVNDLEEIKG